MKSRLPELPEVSLSVLEDLSDEQAPGFLRLVRRRMVATTSSGYRSEPFVYDEVDRKALDAVVIAAHYRGASGEPWVYLRSAARPPVCLRPIERFPDRSLARTRGLWELPAGLVEANENSLDGLVSCACRELAEELGFVVPPAQMHPLGPSTFPAPGVIGERHFYFHVQVTPDEQQSPPCDGSAIEQLGAITVLPLSAALRACSDGELDDAKTELGLRRLAEYLGKGAKSCPPVS